MQEVVDLLGSALSLPRRTIAWLTSMLPGRRSESSRRYVRDLGGSRSAPLVSQLAVLVDARNAVHEIREIVEIDAVENHEIGNLANLDRAEVSDLDPSAPRSRGSPPGARRRPAFRMPTPQRSSRVARKSAPPKYGTDGSLTARTRGIAASAEY